MITLKSEIKQTRNGMRVWQPKHQPQGSRVPPLNIRARGFLPLSARAPWGPPQSNGWYPKITPGGDWIAYGFWQTFIGNLRTGESHEVLLPSGSRLHPSGWLDSETLLCVSENPPRTWRISVRDFIPVDLGVPEWMSVANWTNAAFGHYVIHATDRPFATRDGAVFETPHHQYGAVCAGDHFVTANRSGAYELMHYHGNRLLRVLPADNQWIVNEHGDILRGYYGRVWLHRRDQGDRTEDATITPWGQEGAAGALVRVGDDLWIWTPTCNNGGECWIIGRRYGEVDPIVLPIPSVSSAAVLDNGEWIVAGSDDKGRLKVMWCAMDHPRTKLEANTPPVPTPEPPAPPEPEEPLMNYREFGELWQRKWNEWDIPAKTAAVAARLRVTSDERKLLAKTAEMRRESEARGIALTVTPRTAELEDAFKAVQCPAMVRFASELYRAGHRDVGLSSKNSGNNWTLIDGRKAATDIITIKPTDAQGNVVPGNFTLVDCIVSVGSAEARPAWSVLGPNTDSSRPWMEPPHDGVMEPPAPPEPTTTHRYDGGGNDTNECDICQRSRFDPIHVIPQSKVPHTYDGGEQDTGLCDICQKAPADQIHQTVTPEPKPEPEPEPEPMPEPDAKHAFKPWARNPLFCDVCGKTKDDDIHKLPEPQPGPGTTFDDRRIVAKLDEMIATQKATNAAIDKLRTDMLAATKQITDALKNLKFFSPNPSANKGKAKR